MLTTLFLLAQAAAPASEAAVTVLKRPNMDAMRKHYPQEALENGIEGSAKISCTIGTDGLLTACQVVSEEPAGYGLGAAALKIAPFFTMKSRVPNDTVRIPVQFAISPKDAFISIKGEDGWRILQQPWEWEPLYPLKARQQKVSGEARVECRPSTKTKISCTVLSETPTGHGFGQAALDLQGKLLMAPPPGVTEKVVRMTVKFRPPKG